MLSVTSRPFLTNLRTTRVAPEAWETLTACPLCGDGGGVRDVADIRDGAIVSACVGCESVFMRRRPTSRWFDEFYAQQWDQRGHAEAPTRAAPKPLTKVAQLCAPFLAPRAHVLDVGAGFGGTLLGFREAGHRVHAIERSSHRAAFLRDRLGIPCAQSPIESFTPDEKFDLVCLHHVYEHVSEPAAVIGHVARLLKPGGRIYLAVPDLWQEYPPQAFHFVPHLHWLTPRALARVLARHGFALLATQTTREIQLVAGAADAATVSAAMPAADPAFFTRLCDYVAQAFGGGDGDRTIVWWKGGPEILWERHFIAGPPLVSDVIKVALRARHLVPARAWSHLLPRVLRGDSVRMVTVRVDGPLTLPLAVAPDSPETAVWIK
jgi:SAM-dependent methyltransferase